MGLTVVRDLIGGGRPAPIEMPYNGTLDADSVTLRYKGSLAKIMDLDDITDGNFVTFGLLATAMENFVGILEEEQPITGNYLPNNTDYGVTLRKITPCFPSTVIRGEYARKDAAGSDMTDTGATCAAASATFTIDSDVADEWIGGWVYMLTGASAGALHYIKDSTADTSVTFSTVMAKAVASADTFLVVGKELMRECLFNDTGTGLKSEIAYALHVHRVFGLRYYISAPGFPMQRLDRDKHDGLVIANARLYHDFTIGATNAWSTGITNA